MSKNNRNREVQTMENNEDKQQLTETFDQAPEIKTEATIIEASAPAEEQKPVEIKVSKPAETESEEEEVEVVYLKDQNAKSLRSDNPRVRQFAYQVNQYIALCANKSTSETNLVKKLQQFTQIIRAIINSTDVEVYSAAYAFFKEHRDDILSEQCVFQYIHKLPLEMSIRVQTIYTTFKEFVAANVDKKPFRLDYGLIRDNLKLPAQHPLYNWIRRRLGR